MEAIVVVCSLTSWMRCANPIFSQKVAADARVMLGENCREQTSDGSAIAVKFLEWRKMPATLNCRIS